jgi:hypothetical protein
MPVRTTFSMRCGLSRLGRDIRETGNRKAFGAWILQKPNFEAATNPVVRHGVSQQSALYSPSFSMTPRRGPIRGVEPTNPGEYNLCRVRAAHLESTSLPASPGRKIPLFDLGSQFLLPSDRHFD